jgi:hypothetical protein
MHFIEEPMFSQDRAISSKHKVVDRKVITFLLSVYRWLCVTVRLLVVEND